MIYQSGILAVVAASGAALGVPGLDAFKEYNFQKCPEPYTRINNKCVQTGYTSPQPFCHVGSLLDENRICTIYEAAELLCDGTIVNKFCQETRTANIDAACPSGSSLSHGKCVLAAPVTICPPGAGIFTKGGSAQICGEVLPAAPECAADYTFNGNVCVRELVATPSTVCPENTTLNAENGLCEEEVVYAPVCPRGAERRPDGVCTVVSPPVVVCPAETTPIGFDCVGSETRAPRTICGLGGQLQDGVCTLIAPYPETPVCRNGNLVDGECVSTVETKEEYTCPLNYTLMETKYGLDCVNTFTYDCSTTHYECDPSRAADITVRKETKLPFEVPAQLRKVDTQAMDLVNNDMLAHTVHEVHDYCYKVPIITPKTCSETRSAQPVPFCAEGTFNGHKCLSQVIDTPDLVCEATVGQDGVCTVISHYPAEFVCEAGFTLSGGHKHTVCTREILSPGRYICNEGNLVGTQCERIVESICPIADCRTVAQFQPSLQCPIDYILHASHFATCTAEEILLPIYVCPPNSEIREDDRTCLREVPELLEERKAIVPSELNCPVEFALEAHKCVNTAYTLPGFGCRVGDLSGHGVCLVHENATPFCSPGALLKSDDTCAVPVSTEPLRIGAPIMKINKDWAAEVQKTAISLGVDKLPPAKMLGLPKFLF